MFSKILEMQMLHIANMSNVFYIYLHRYYQDRDVLHTVYKEVCRNKNGIIPINVKTVLYLYINEEGSIKRFICVCVYLHEFSLY